MTQSSVLKLVNVRTARETNEAVESLGQLPSFVHKWTKLRRNYRPEEVGLPEAVTLSGCVPNWNQPVIGVGGTRSPSVETFCLVNNIIQRISSQDVTVISGGVPGVDLAAHLAAIGTGGSTYGVMANPASFGLAGHEWFNDVIQSMFLKKGGFISEYSDFEPIFSDVYLERLLQRDRIISGLCDAFLVFECRENSATVDTAKRAFLQNKKVFCIDSGRRTARVGIFQLLEEYGFQVLSLLEMTAMEIADKIVEGLSASIML